MGKSVKQQPVKTESFYKKYRWEILFSAIAAVSFLLRTVLGNAVKDFDYFHYIFSYAIGFRQKLFAGTFFNIFFGYATYSKVKFFVSFFLLIICILMGLLCARAVKKTDISKSSPFVLVLAVVLFQLADMYIDKRYFDIFLILAVILSLLCLQNKKFRWAVPVLTFFAAATDQAYFYTYFIIVLFAMLFAFSGEKEKKNTIVFFSSVGLSLLSFVYFQFLTAPIQKDMNSVISDWFSRGNITVDKALFYGEYFVAAGERIRNMLITDIAQRAQTLFCAVLPAAGLILIAMLFWCRMLAVQGKKTVEKAACIAGLLMPIAALTISLFIAFNITSVICFILFFEFSMILLTAYYSENIKLEHLSGFCEKNFLPVMLLLMFSVAMLFFGGDLFRPEVKQFIEKWWMPF